MNDLTPPEHQHSPAVDDDARWLAHLPQHERPAPVILELRRRYDLTALEATVACREAALIRARSI